MFFGSYRKPREINWIVGLVLLQVILAFGLTGYLLPWDQRAYWATVVTINISRLTPGVGEMVAALLRGGADIGALTLTRWYAVHVLVLPAVARRARRRAPVSDAAAWHFRSGHAAARAVARCSFRIRPRAISPWRVVAGVLLAVLAWSGAPALEPPADPTSSDYIPRPDWYFLGLFQLLKYFPGQARGHRRARDSRRRDDVARAAAVARSRTHAPGEASAVGAVAVRRRARGLVDAHGARRAGQTAAVRGGAWNLRQIGGMATIQTEERCVRCHRPDGLAAPIEPGRISKPLDWLDMHVADPNRAGAGAPRCAADQHRRDTERSSAALQRLRTSAPPQLDAETTHIYKLLSSHCVNCHLIDGVGGKEGPELTAMREET